MMWRYTRPKYGSLILLFAIYITHMSFAEGANVPVAPPSATTSSSTSANGLPLPPSKGKIGSFTKLFFDSLSLFHFASALSKKSLLSKVCETLMEVGLKYIQDVISHSLFPVSTFTYNVKQNEEGIKAFIFIPPTWTTTNCRSIHDIVMTEIERNMRCASVLLAHAIYFLQKYLLFYVPNLLWQLAYGVWAFRETRRTQFTPSKQSTRLRRIG